MRIGNIVFENYPVFLAPMEDVTDYPFRKMCKFFGVDFMYTEFVSSDGLIRGGKKGMKKLMIDDDERPIGIQLYGHDPDTMAEAAKIVEFFKPEVLDLNFGCPVKKISRRGAGAGLLQNIPRMIEITEKVVKAVNLPVTAKTRLGWDDKNIVIEDVAERLQDVGVKALTIHARTKSQMYAGVADWSWIGKVKTNPRIIIPIIGNGDIDSPQDALDCFQKFGIDAIMIGRAAIGKPWLFKEIKHYLNKKTLLPKISMSLKVEYIKKQLDEFIAHKNERIGIVTMRRHFANFMKYLPDSRELKIKLLTTDNYNETISVLNLISEKYKEY